MKSQILRMALCNMVEDIIFHYIQTEAQPSWTVANSDVYNLILSPTGTEWFLVGSVCLVHVLSPFEEGMKTEI